MSKQPRGRKGWTDYSTRKLIKLYNTGVPIIEMAQQLKRSKSSVLNKLYNLRKQDVIPSEVRGPGRPVRWTPAEDAMLLAVVECVVERTGRTPGAVASRLNSLRTLKRLHEPAA